MVEQIRAAQSCAALPGYVASSQWNFIAPAGWYSQFSGLMAGLTITALVVVLQTHSEYRDSRARDRIAMVAVVTVFGLLVSSFLYAQTTGEDRCAHGLIDTAVVGAILAIAALDLFVALAWIGSYFRLSRDALVLLRVATWLLAGFGLLFVAFSSWVVLVMLRGGWIGTAPVLPVVAVAMAGGWAVAGGRGRTKDGLPDVHRLAYCTLAMVVLGGVIFVVSGFHDFQKAPGDLPPLLAWVPLVLTAPVSILAVRSLPPSRGSG